VIYPVITYIYFDILDDQQKGLSNMDYGFAPGGTGYDNLARTLLERRPNTTVIHQGAILDVEDFINHLDTNAGIAKPVGDLLIVSHGNASGRMAIDLDSTSVNPDGTPATQTTYEVLEQAVASHSVRIPAALHNAQPNPILFDVHILGCRIGQAPPFVQRLKDAFGRPRSVTAPKHFHLAGGIGSSRRRITRFGSYEYLLYSFEITRPDRERPDPARLRTKIEAVNAFDNHGFTFIPAQAGGVGAAVPRAVWQREIPNNLQGRVQRRFVNLGQNVGRGFRRFRIEHQFRNEVQTFPYTISPVAADPGNQAAKEAMLRASITAHPQFQAPPAHAFPFYQRFGYGNVNDFLNGFSWVCDWRRQEQQLVCVGSRRVYTVIVPVVDPVNQNLLFNLFPVAGSGLVQVTNLPRNDVRLFLTV
jgi:hypothetical protein